MCCRPIRRAGAFAALKSDGSVVTWGTELYGGNSCPADLQQVLQVCGSASAFAALTLNGSLIAWGHPFGGGLAPSLHDVFATFPSAELREVADGREESGGEGPTGPGSPEELIWENVRDASLHETALKRTWQVQVLLLSNLPRTASVVWYTTLRESAVASHRLQVAFASGCLFLLSLALLCFHKLCRTRPGLVLTLEMVTAAYTALESIVWSHGQQEMMASVLLVYIVCFFILRTHPVPILLQVVSFNLLLYMPWTSMLISNPFRVKLLLFSLWLLFASTGYLTSFMRKIHAVKTGAVGEARTGPRGCWPRLASSMDPAVHGAEIMARRLGLLWGEDVPLVMFSSLPPLLTASYAFWIRSAQCFSGDKTEDDRKFEPVAFAVYADALLWLTLVQCLMAAATITLASTHPLCALLGAAALLAGASLVAVINSRFDVKVLIAWVLIIAVVTAQMVCHTLDYLHLFQLLRPSARDHAQSLELSTPSSHELEGHQTRMEPGMPARWPQDSAQMMKLSLKLSRLGPSSGSRSSGPSSEGPTEVHMPNGRRSTSKAAGTILAGSAVAVVRHGEREDTVWNSLWYQKQHPYDCPITAEGVRQARDIAKSLHACSNFGIVVSSPYLRCVQTAVIIAERLGLMVLLDHELGEVFGRSVFSDMSMFQDGVITPWRSRRTLYETMKQWKPEGCMNCKTPVQHVCWKRILGQPPVAGESLSDARKRYARRFLTYLARSRRAEKNVVVVSHGHMMEASAPLRPSSGVAAMEFRPERRAPGDFGDMKGITQDEISKLQKAMKQKEFRDHIDEYTRELLIDTASDGLSQQFLKGHEEVSKDYKVMQRMACKGGQPMPMSVRAELLKGQHRAPKKAPSRDAITPAELKEMRENTKRKKKTLSGVPKEEEEDESKVEKKKASPLEPGRIRVPAHRLIHSGHLDLSDFMEVNGRADPNLVNSIPRFLRLVVELPTVKRSSEIKMEVTSDNVVVEVDGKFYLDMPLPYEVNESSGSAKFDKAKQTLTLELPVVPKMPKPEALAAARRLQGLHGNLVEEEKDLEGLEELEDSRANSYFFGTGSEGLGYYRDLRQPRQRPRPRPPPQEVLDLPLVEEVVIVPAPLPEYARDFMETSSALTTRLPADEVEVEQEEPELLHQLGRQNLLLRIPLPHQSFADLRLSAVGRRLTISFCTRSASASTASTASRWRRRSLRRTLGGQVDLQQSYADVIGSKETSELQVVLRKAIKEESWESAFFRTNEPDRAEADEAVALGLAAAPETEDAPTSTPSVAPEDSAPRAPEVDAADDAAPVEDSAELDVAQPMVQDTTEASALRQVDASAAVQSAMVMGQAVLLQNRLMYQLLPLPGCTSKTSHSKAPAWRGSVHVVPGLKVLPSTCSERVNHVPFCGGFLAQLTSRDGAEEGGLDSAQEEKLNRKHQPLEEKRKKFLTQLKVDRLTWEYIQHLLGELPDTAMVGRARSDSAGTAMTARTDASDPRTGARRVRMEHARRQQAERAATLEKANPISLQSNPLLSRRQRMGRLGEEEAVDTAPAPVRGRLPLQNNPLLNRRPKLASPAADGAEQKGVSLQSNPLLNRRPKADEAGVSLQGNSLRQNLAAQADADGRDRPPVPLQSNPLLMRRQKLSEKTADAGASTSGRVREVSNS
eukprot:g8999.t1